MEPEQPELDLGLKDVEPRAHRGEGETGGSASRKEVDPSAVTWRRVHTKEKCTSCIAEIDAALKAGGRAHAAWSASYVRTERDRREALCFIHAAPRRHLEGLAAQRGDPIPGAGKPVPPRRDDTYE